MKTWFPTQTVALPSLCHPDKANYGDGNAREKRSLYSGTLWTGLTRHRTAAAGYTASGRAATSRSRTQRPDRFTGRAKKGTVQGGHGRVNMTYKWLSRFLLPQGPPYLLSTGTTTLPWSSVSSL